MPDGFCLQKVSEDNSEKHPLERKKTNELPTDKFTGVAQTLLIPLLSRARITLAYANLLNDPKAVEVVKILSGHFPEIGDIRSIFNDLGNAARARTMDDAIKNYVQEHPTATIVNLGAGFDSAFSRIDNGKISWFDIDLPAVIEIRKIILPETDRSHCIACSILDDTWMREINPAKNGLFVFAGGVLPYFSEQEVKGLVGTLADVFPGSEFMFDVVSRLGRFYSHQQIRKAGISSAPMRWVVDHQNDLHKWDSRIFVLAHIPMFARIERAPNFDKQIVRIMDKCNKLWNMSVFHLKFDV